MPAVDRTLLHTLLPHSGTMCLLAQVNHWDERHIECVANSHRDADNPLRVGNCLPVEAGIEYAAQAMAIHGSLCERARLSSDAAQAYRPRLGYLAVLSRVQWQVQRLDDVPAELSVQAEQLMATEDGSSYQFSLRSGDKTLLSGEAVVALAAN